jgi:hypothetical protein
MMETTDALASGAGSTDDEAVIMHNGSARSQWLWHDKDVEEREFSYQIVRNAPFSGKIGRPRRLPRDQGVLTDAYLYM